MFNHTPSCERVRQAYFDAVASWDRRFPRACKMCRGLGFLHYSDDPSDKGVSLAPGTMDFTDPCPDCFEQGRCPRCGENLSEIKPDEWECPVCHWNSIEAEAGKFDGEPEFPECDCWERQSDEDLFDSVQMLVGVE